MRGIPLYVVAVLVGLTIIAFGMGTLRGLTRPGRHSSNPDEARPTPPGLRVTYWCEICGTEVLLLRSGSEQPPRHCTEPMHRREEVAVE